MKRRVLVFPAGSEISLEIHRSLRFNKHFELIGASSVDDHGRFVYAEYIDNVPFVDDERFIDAIKDIVKSHSIDFIFPAHDSAVLKLAQSAKEIGVPVVTSPAETTKIARSKALTYKTLNKTIRIPELIDPKNVDTFPVFVKPDVGQGSKGAHKVNNADELSRYLKNSIDMLVLEYLPGEEYTVDCFTSEDGKLLYAQARQRRRVQNGISVNSVPVEGDEFEDFAKAINKRLIFRGVWFFQVKRDQHGDLCLLEIAPRVAGTMALSRMSGVNLPLLSLYQMSGIPISVIKNDYHLEIDRALGNSFNINIEYDTVYIDFDDTIVTEGKVNHGVIAFIYKSINEGKRIVLITKHLKDIKRTLKQYLIDEKLFNEILHIDKAAEKYTHISERAIFIDDSFAERRRVHEMLKIPVFDVSEIVELL